jgi:nucleoside-diphosphate-sugar epimerase
MVATDQSVVLTGGAGLVGHNLLIVLTRLGYSNITVIDKHRYNLDLVKKIHPKVNCIHQDLSHSGEWEALISAASALVMLQAQIGNTDRELFLQNNIKSTELILTAAQKGNPYLVHVSSSVVNSQADDDYVKSKTRQEELVRQSQLDYTILRPTLMFGNFDRKHLGWLSRFMSKSPIFPIPGNGKFERQPLFVEDFCNIIANCITTRKVGGIYDISGLEKIDYIDLIKLIRKHTKATTMLVKIPYKIFHLLLTIYALFDRDPPFTTTQLEALTIDESFTIIDWPAEFDVSATPLPDAIESTFTQSKYTEYVLEF